MHEYIHTYNYCACVGVSLPGNVRMLQVMMQHIIITNKTNFTQHVQCSIQCNIIVQE